MSQESLEKFGAYRLATELFDLVVHDMSQIEKHAQTYRLVAQQVASADSICSNIEEGHGRETTRDYMHFLVIAHGSARETRGRYLRMKHWLPPEVITDRVSRCDAILGILSKTIVSLRQRPVSPAPRPSGLSSTSSHAPQAPPRPFATSSPAPQASSL